MDCLGYTPMQSWTCQENYCKRSKDIIQDFLILGLSFLFGVWKKIDHSLFGWSLWLNHSPRALGWLHLCLRALGLGRETDLDGHMCLLRHCHQRLAAAGNIHRDVHTIPSIHIHQHLLFAFISVQIMFHYFQKKHLQLFGLHSWKLTWNLKINNLER